MNNYDQQCQHWRHQLTGGRVTRTGHLWSDCLLICSILRQTNQFYYILQYMYSIYIYYILSHKNICQINIFILYYITVYYILSIYIYIKYITLLESTYSPPYSIAKPFTYWTWSDILSIPGWLCDCKVNHVNSGFVIASRYHAWFWSIWIGNKSAKDSLFVNPRSKKLWCYGVNLGLLRSIYI